MVNIIWDLLRFLDVSARWLRLYVRYSWQFSDTTLSTAHQLFQTSAPLTRSLWYQVSKKQLARQKYIWKGRNIPGLHQTWKGQLVLLLAIFFTELPMTWLGSSVYSAFTMFLSDKIILLLKCHKWVIALQVLLWF